ncbi:MAG: MiaB/RimO family radical SAM methylthiotransferase [Elusimicrobia bacterium]|nr:MiaB/RimO family radical SAM methylthiotransferase [Elusimicrobiota bacterium]
MYNASMRFYVETFGCQMNVADSLEMARRLRARGYRATPDMDRADVVLVNTCTVRDHAEHKALSFLGRLADWKELVPGRRIVFAGCAAERLKDQLQRRFPQVDAVVGAKSISDFDRLLDEQGTVPLFDGNVVAQVPHPPLRGTFPQEGKENNLLDERGTVPLFDGKKEWTDAWGWSAGLGPSGLPGEGATAYITIMRGCNFGCTYCVVPSVRGRELYRPALSILDEAAERVANGQREVLLLGQTVNSYRPVGSNPGRDGKDIRHFSDLLEAVSALPGIERVRYMSPHPHYIDELFAERLGRLPQVPPHIHLPVQSGSDAVLSRMRRNYTRDDFCRKLDLLRRHVPGLAVTTDFIVGFPGETDDDFEASLRLGREADLDGAYIFKYSPRPGTASAQGPDDVSDALKEERLARLMAETDSRSRAKMAAWVGQTQTILVEAVRPEGDGFELEGRTAHCRKMYVSSRRSAAVGATLEARVDRADGKTLYGTALDDRV